MKTTTRQIIGLLNTTLTGIRITTGEVSEDSARLIMLGIFLSIPTKQMGDEFIKYCADTYNIQFKKQ